MSYVTVYTLILACSLTTDTWVTKAQEFQQVQGGKELYNALGT